MSARRRILVVDDEPLILELIVAVLDGPAWEVHTEERGREALDYARGVGGDIHLLITDMAMPDLDGEQLASQLEPLSPRLRVLLMSGRPEDGQLAAARPNWDYMKKPFSIPELTGKVEALLGPVD